MITLRTAIKCALILSVLVLLAGVAVATEPLADDRAIRSSDEAVKRALEYTGFDEMEGFTLPSNPAEIAQVVTMVDSLTPFLTDSIDGRRAWLVTLQDVQLHFGPPVAKRDIYPAFDFRIYIDSTNGVLLRMYSRSKQPRSNNYMPRAPLATAEHQLRNMSGEVYYGFAPFPPRMTFVEAIHRGISPPFFTASEADMLYIRHSLKGEPGPAWVIHLYGCYPDPHGIDHMRNVINAITGNRTIAVNVPLPTKADMKKLRSADSTGDSE